MHATNFHPAENLEQSLEDEIHILAGMSPDDFNPTYFLAKPIQYPLLEMEHGLKVGGLHFFLF